MRSRRYGEPEIAEFPKESDLCTAFISQLPTGWVAYPETEGFDIVLLHTSGAQIGVEAKLKLNTTVVLQAMPPRFSSWRSDVGPDFRAILVPWGRSNPELESIAKRLGLTVIRMKSKELYQRIKNNRSVWSHHKDSKYDPELPFGKRRNHYYDDGSEDWYDCCPWKRLTLPDYVPDVVAGRPAPVQLSQWKIKAIKILIILERRGYVTRNDFKELKIDPGRWMEARWGWLDKTEIRGRFCRGIRTPDYRKVHALNYQQIEADYDKWAPKDLMPPISETPLFEGAKIEDRPDVVAPTGSGPESREGLV